MMNVDQADAIDNLMKQGFTRVQAIKIFYEQSLAKYYKKQYHGEDVGFDQTGLVKSNVEHFNALEQSHLIEKPITILGRRFSKPGDPGHVEGEEEHYDGLPPHHPRTFVHHPDHPDVDGDRSPSPLSLDSCFRTMPPTADLPHDMSNEIVEIPTHVPTQEHLIASSEEKLEIKAIAAVPDEIFPTIEFENEVKYEEEDSLCGPDPTISNVAKFLSSCDFTTEEKQEFFYLLSQGMNIDEASDRIYHARLERSMNTLPPAAKGKLTQEVLLTTINYDKHNKTTTSSTKQSIRPRYPLRLHGFNGIRDDDLQMLLDRGYTIEQAQFLCDFFYDNGLEFFQKFYSIIPEVLGDRAPYAAPHNEPLFVPPRNNHVALSVNTGPSSVGGKEMGAPAVIGNQGVAHIVDGMAGMKMGHHHHQQHHQYQQPIEEEDFIIDAESVNADTLVQLKRLKTFARGGFKSNFSIENNCAVSEHEALKLGLIVSQQEADYGINMYDALLPSDEQQIEKLIRTGLTLDEAILKVFESRFGKTKLDTSALSPTNGRGSGGYTILKDQAPAPVAAPTTEYEAADKLESEIALLMMSGYTREKAVKILLERKKKEQQESSHPSSEVGSATSLNSSSVARAGDISGMSYPSVPNVTVNNSSPQRRLNREPSHERMEREALMSQLPPSAQRRSVVNSSPVQRMKSSASDDRTEVVFSPALNLRSTSGTEVPSAVTPNQPQQQQLQQQQHQPLQRFNSEYEAMIHHQLSMDPFSASRNTHSTSHHSLPYIPPVDSRRAPPTQAYDTSAYGGGGNMRTPTNYRNAPPQGSYNSPDYYHPPAPYPTPMPAHQPPHQQQHVSNIYRNEEYRILRDIPSDEKAFRIGVLISQQEAAFGTNMYQSIHTADAGEMTQLLARGYNEDDPALLLFERKFGRTPPIPETMYVPQQQRSPLPPPPASYEQPGPGVVRVPGINTNGNNARSPVRVPSNNSMPRSGTSSANRSYNNSPTIVVNNAYPAPANSVGVSSTSPHTPVRAPAVYSSNNTGSPSSTARRGNPPIPPSSQQPPSQYARSNSAPIASQQNMRRVPSMHQQTPPSSDISDIHPNDLHMLIGMGFSQFQAIQALRLKNYNVQLAAEYLLEH